MSPSSSVHRAPTTTMCCGHLPAAPESADLIAIIHPSVPESSNPSPLRGRLRLSNQAGHATSTEFASSVADRDQAHPSTTLYGRIHQFGAWVVHDRDSSGPESTCSSGESICSDNPILYRFPLNLAPGVKPISTHLNLGVGGGGVIGRTISIVDERQTLLGQGIIGRI